MNIKHPKTNSERYTDCSCMIIDGGGCVYAHGVSIITTGVLQDYNRSIT